MVWLVRWAYYGLGTSAVAVMCCVCMKGME